MSKHRKQSPIIICGSARSGTTFIRNLLNEHPDIAVSDEYFLYKTPSIVKFFKEWSAAIPILADRGDPGGRKADLMRMLWFYSSQENLLEKGLTSRRYGNKTPGAKHFIDFYDYVFENNPPLYVYVLRQGKSVFLSVRNTDWGKKVHISGQIRRYVDSVKAIENFQKWNPERAFIIQLDKIEPTHEARLKETHRLLDFIEEKPVAEILRYAKTCKPAHTTKQVRRKDPETIQKHFSEGELKILANHKEYQSILKKYGYESYSNA